MKVKELVEQLEVFDEDQDVIVIAHGDNYIIDSIKSMGMGCEVEIEIS